jgi:hypothetical protein
LALAIYGLGTAFATAADFFSIQNSSAIVSLALTETLENLVLVFTLKFAVSFALFCLGIRKIEASD